jgi:hypothetical protein
MHTAIALLLAAATSAAAPPVHPTDPRLAMEHRAWIDDHARWNSQHMAAARRLEAVAAALRRHDTSFDGHGMALRDHQRRIHNHGHDAAARAAHGDLRSAHDAAAARHQRLMDDVADLERTIAVTVARRPKTGR